MPLPSTLNKELTVQALAVDEAADFVVLEFNRKCQAHYCKSLTRTLEDAPAKKARTAAPSKERKPRSGGGSSPSNTHDGCG